MANGITISKDAFLRAGEKGDTDSQREMLFDGIEHITKLAPIIESNKMAIKKIWWWLSGISMGIMGIAYAVIRSGLLHS